MNQKWDANAGCFGVRKGLMPIRIGGNQAITLHNYPLIRIVGPIFLDPVHFAPSIAEGDRLKGNSLL